MKRWAVAYIDGDGSDDWQMMRNNHVKYFDSEAWAKDFASKHKFKGKPFYWQPSIWCEEGYEITITNWRRVEAKAALGEK